MSKNLSLTKNFIKSNGEIRAALKEISKFNIKENPKGWNEFLHIIEN